MNSEERAIRKKIQMEGRQKEVREIARKILQKTASCE
jgi:hypothetical protein